MQTQAIRIHEVGGPDVMRWETIEVGEPGPGEARIRQTAVGVNFIDVYLRSGLYPTASLPAVIGQEGAGVVEAIGPGVTEVTVGQRVAYAGPPIGAYAAKRLFPAARLVPLPEGVDDKTAAAIMLKGMTARYLLRQTYVVKPGETIVVHAAAGGVGLILCQWAKLLGVKVIGVVSNEAKAALAMANGATQTIVLPDAAANRDPTRARGFAARVRELTDGAGVPVVYDSVGKDTFDESLDCLKPRGLMVSFGQSSGLIPPIDLRVLQQKGSLYVTRPSLHVYTHSRQELLENARDLFSVILSGAVKIHVGQTFPLAEAARAHRDLESRKTTGSTVLTP